MPASAAFCRRDRFKFGLQIRSGILLHLRAVHLVQPDGHAAVLGVCEAHVHGEPAHGRILDGAQRQPRPGRLGCHAQKHDCPARCAKVHVGARRKRSLGASRQLWDGEGPGTCCEAQCSGAVATGIAVADAGVEWQR